MVGASVQRRRLTIDTVIDTISYICRVDGTSPMFVRNSGHSAQLPVQDEHYLTTYFNIYHIVLVLLILIGSVKGTPP